MYFPSLLGEHHIMGRREKNLERRLKQGLVKLKKEGEREKEREGEKKKAYREPGCSVLFETGIIS